MFRRLSQIPQVHSFFIISAFLPGVGNFITRRNAIPKYSLDYTITVNTLRQEDSISFSKRRAIMLNQVISFQSENSLSSASRIHPPVTNKCRHFSTGSCKFPISTMEYFRFSHYVPCSYFCFSACLFTFYQETRFSRKSWRTRSPRRSCRLIVIDNWWGVLYPPPALSGGVMPEETQKIRAPIPSLTL